MELASAAGRKHLGARIGMAVVLNTWGSAMPYHQRIYMIAPVGAIPPMVSA